MAASPKDVELSVKTSSKSKKPQMYSTAQLSDLFRRLDKDGSGELDLDEFMLVAEKLKLQKLSGDDIARIFQAADKKSQGKLNLQQFISAYQRLYTENQKSSIQSGSAAKNNDYVTAVRYGHNANGIYIFEVYRGSAEDINEKLIFPALDKTKTYDDHIKAAKASPEKYSIAWNGSIETLNEMIGKDSVENKGNKQKILWWVDVAIPFVSSSKVTKYITIFGLPNEKSFKSSFAHFSQTLPATKHHRIFAGTGLNAQGGQNSSLSIFVQSMWLKNRPVVFNVSEWLSNFQSNPWLESTYRYYQSKLAFFPAALFAPGDSYVAAIEKVGAYSMADSIASRLMEARDEEAHNKQEYSKRRGTIQCLKDSADSEGSSPPIHYVSLRNDLPTWLHTIAETRRSPAELVLDNLSISVVDNGNGANCTITIRQLDAELYSSDAEKAQIDIKIRARLGIMGRILDGVRIKIFEVMCNEGKSAVCGELDDCSFGLVSVITAMVHSFSMDTIGAIDYWLNLIDEEVAEVAVSKHSFHQREVQRIINLVSNYISASKAIFENLYEASKLDPGVKSITAKIFSANEENPSYENINPFLGIAPLTYLTTILDGEETLEVKGLTYWNEQINNLSERNKTVKDNITDSVEEKRSFYSYVLTVATVFLAPLSVLTGYFGMNFDNMSELGGDAYPDYTGTGVEGVQLLWIVLGVSYFSFFVFSIHYRVLYSAT